MNRLTKVLTALLLMAVVMFSCIQAPAAAAEMTVSSSSGDKVSVMGDIKIDKPTSGNIVTILGNADIENSVAGDVIVLLGNASVNAKVSGQVVTVFGKVKLGEKAEIAGDVLTIGSLERTTGTKIYGQEVKINSGVIALARAILISVFAFFALVLGVILISIFKYRFQSISFHIEERITKKFFIGLLGLLGLFILFLLLFITVVFPIIFLLFLLMAEIAVGIFLGKQILKVFSLNLNVYLQYIIGLVTMTLMKIVLSLLILEIGFVASTVLYGLLNGLIYSLGIGILLESKFGTSYLTETGQV